MARLFALLIAIATVTSASAECIELKIIKREPFAGGMSFGDVGPYERIVGIAKFAIDPKHPRNAMIVDLDKAPRNPDAELVEFQSDVFILAPKNPMKGNGAVLYDVNNRGLKLALAFFNEGTSSNDPSRMEHAGNGYLMRRGFTLAWCGWIGELLPGNDRMLLQAPIAREGRGRIVGDVRFEFATDTATDSLPIARREGHGSYEPTDLGEREGVLTWRMREGDSREVIPRALWRLERTLPEPVKGRVPGTLPQIRCKLSGGFRPGYIYELTCQCRDPIVQGCGLAAVRDFVSFLKYDTTAKNPLAREEKCAIDRALGFGISQSGRFLRHFVYQGFNADEKQRKVFDGLMPHVAGGGLGFFNHRFAQPTRHNGQHEDHLYPNDIFPFTYGDLQHSYVNLQGRVVTEARIDGILHNDAKFGPVIMHTQSAAEYWHRSGSLVHTDPCGLRDVPIPQNVRIYTFGGTQHGPAPDPPKPGNGDHLPNPGNFKPICRALLDALDKWAKDGTKPPDSVYPKIAERTLVGWKQSSSGFPSIPGVRYPTVIQQPSFLYLGPEFNTKGIITLNPPEVVGHYRVLVPRSDKDGNNMGTLLPPEVAVPLATHTGWNLRKKEVGAEGMLLNLQGSYIPLPRTKAERIASGDPRRSIEEQYHTFAEYKDCFQKICGDYVQKRWLLQEDADRLVASRDKVRNVFDEPKTERKR